MAHAISDPSHPSRSDLRETIEKDIKTLTELTEHISAFTQWWDWVKIETDIVGEGQSIEFQLDALQDKATIRKWKELKYRYAAYVKMVGEWMVL